MRLTCNLFLIVKIAVYSRRMVLAICLLLLHIGVISAQTKQILFEHLTVERGLSQSSVLSIAQDSMGFMWFGTKNGLNRFDSQQFEVYRNNVHDETSISSSVNINALLTDSKGNLWVGTQNGLNKYLPESNSFIRFKHNPNQKNSLSNNTIRYIYEDKQRNIWIGTDSGLNKLVDESSFERFLTSRDKDRGIAHLTVKAIYQDSENTLWIGTQGGLTSMVYKNGRYRYKTYYHDPLDTKSIAANDVNAITEDLNHNLWIGTHFQGVDLFDKTNKTFKHFNAEVNNSNSLSSNVIRKITVEKSGKLWIATLNGITVFDPIGYKFTVLQHNPENATSLNQNSIYDILQDRSGSIWVGTYYGGINVYHPNTIPFKTYKYFSYKNSLSSNIISAIVEDRKQNLWIGTEAEGLNYYDRNTGRFTSFKSNPKRNSLSSNLIKAISIDKNKNLWIAAYEGGVDFYNTETGIFKNYKLEPLNPNSASSNRVSCLLNDSEGRVWVGCRGKGLFLYDKETDLFNPLSPNSESYHLSSRYINSIFQDQEGGIWIAAEGGVYFLSKNSKKFRQIRLKNNTSIINNINCIQQDSKGAIWFGSYNEGLIFFEPKKKAAIIYTTKNGLPSNTITGIVEDNDGYIWISSDKGLARFDSNSFKIYTRNDGLPGNVFNYHSFLKDSKGELFFGGYNGMVSFFPEEIKPNTKAPELVFTHLRLFNNEVLVGDSTRLLKKSINKTEEITLAYNQNIFSIDFSALNYINSEKNRYAYKLEGFDKQWIYTSHATASFNNLPDGNYTLLVKGANNDGVWSKEAARLIIHVSPPFWRTWWAYLIYAFLASSVLFIMIRFLLMKALLKREHEIHQMKLDFFTNVSHEIRTPLTLILGPLEKLIQDTQETKALNRQLLGVNKNVKRLSRLVNELMDFRKAEAGKMSLNVTVDNMVSFAKEVYLSFQHLAIQRKINYQFICEEEFIEIYLDKAQLEKVLFNLLSNAFKFAPDGGIVNLKISLEENIIKLRVSDNGVGVPEESKQKVFTDFYQAGNYEGRSAGTGIGLALSKRIAKLHHGDLILEDKEKDTCFCLILKSGFAHFKKDELKESLNHENPETYKLQSEVEAKDYEESTLEPNHSADKPWLLIVDDNKEIRDFIIETLRKEYRIEQAQDGVEALDIALENIPDLIISDVMMPVMDGFELCRKLKTDDRTSHIPVILLTARSGEIHELDGLKTGADVYLTKPFGMRKLQLTIENLLVLQENMRKKFSQQLTLQPTNVIIESSDEEFLNKVLKLLEENISNSDFNVNQFAFEIGMSTPVFYRKIKALTGLTVNNFIKSIRLKRAAQLLEQKAGTIYEIAYMVGFNDPKYFSKEFRKQFGQAPSGYS